MAAAGTVQRAPCAPAAGGLAARGRIARAGAPSRPAAAGGTSQSAQASRGKGLGDRLPRRRRRRLETARSPAPAPCSPAVRAARSAVVPAAQKREMMMWEALREGLDEEMERDPTVCLMGALARRRRRPAARVPAGGHSRAAQGCLAQPSACLQQHPGCSSCEQASRLQAGSSARGGAGT